MTARRTAVLVVAGLAASCGGSSSPTAATSSSQCSTSEQVTFVRDTLQNIYYWYKQLPDPDQASFDSPEAYLEAVRYRPLDTTFSYITSKASSDAFFSESQFIGFGLSYKQTADLGLRITQTFPGSSAAESGLDRGDYLLSIGGKPVAELLQTGEISTIFGPEQIGFTLDFSWRDLQGREWSATLSKRLVTIPTVSQTAVVDAGPLRVGYVHLRNFVTPSVAALDAAFGQLREAGATDLVLDLRYNGGGLLSVAQHLGGLIGGTSRSGDVFLQLVHNDKNASRNSTIRFENVAPALGVPRLVVITTRGSASASEDLVNGLRPYMDVTVVGDTTYGKPVGQYGFDFCDKVLYPVSFLVTNARFEADFFGGIPADCAAADDLDQPLASPSEASFAEALYVLQSGQCSGAAAAQAELQARLRARVRELPRDGWRRLLNAW